MAIARFGPYRLDTRSLELRKDGRLLGLRPQPCRLLGILLAQPRQLVTREQLRRALWPDDVFVRFDLGLNSCLKQIRRALGDSPEARAYVETLTRRGYRFAADVEWAPDTGGPHPPLLAVRRFEMLDGPSARGASIAEGLTEDVLVHLSRLDPARMRVAAGEHPSAAYVLEGRIRSTRDRLRVTARLVATDELRHLWAGSYDTPSPDALDASSQVAASLAGDLADALDSFDGLDEDRQRPHVLAMAP